MKSLLDFFRPPKPPTLEDEIRLFDAATDRMQDILHEIWRQRFRSLSGEISSDATSSNLLMLQKQLQQNASHVRLAVRGFEIK